MNNPTIAKFLEAARQYLFALNVPESGSQVLAFQMGQPK